MPPIQTSRVPKSGSKGSLPKRTRSRRRRGGDMDNTQWNPVSTRQEGIYTVTTLRPEDDLLDEWDAETSDSEADEEETSLSDKDVHGGPSPIPKSRRKRSPRWAWFRRIWLVRLVVRYYLSWRRSFAGMKEFAPYLLRFFKDAVRVGGIRYIVQFLFQSVQNTVPALSLYFSKKIIDLAHSVVDRQEKLDPFRLIYLLGSRFALEFLSYQISTRTRKNQGMVRHRFNVFVQQHLIKCRSRLDIVSLTTREVHSKLKSAQQLSSGPYAMFPITLLQGWQSIFSAVSQFGVLARMIDRDNWTMAACALFLSAMTSRMRFRFTGRHDEVWEMTDPLYFRLGTLSGISSKTALARTVKILGLGPWLLKEYDAAKHELGDVDVSRSGMSMSAMDALSRKLSDSVLYASWIFLAARKQGRAKLTSMGELMFLESSISGLLGTIYGLEHVSWQFQGISQAVRDFYESVNLDPSISEPQSPVPYAARQRESGNGESFRGMKIEFKNVSFHYPAPSAVKLSKTKEQYKPKLVLQDISFVVEAGQLIALVGFNGSGKSTLVNLITRLYEPTSGEIYINDRDIREYSSADLQKSMAVLFQSTPTLPLTFSEYIGVGSVNDVENIEKIKSAASRSDALKVIESLPYGFDSYTQEHSNGDSLLHADGGIYFEMNQVPRSKLVAKPLPPLKSGKDSDEASSDPLEKQSGKEERSGTASNDDEKAPDTGEKDEKALNGDTASAQRLKDGQEVRKTEEQDLEEKAAAELAQVTLSGGQWQKVTLSQCEMRLDATLAVYDEPVANLDPRAESEFFKQICGMREQRSRTIIFSSHRFNITRRADVVFVMEGGKMIEQGSHTELMNIKDGKYRTLFTLQAEGFQD